MEALDEAVLHCAGVQYKEGDSRGMERWYHTCGQEIWLADERSGLAYYYEDQRSGKRILVAHCPRCHKTLTRDVLRKELEDLSP